MWKRKRYSAIRTFAMEMPREAFQKGFDSRNAEVEKLLRIIEKLSGALKCNETFHSLGGIDDCEPCKAQAHTITLLEELVR
jgi:hypothetical protein